MAQAREPIEQARYMLRGKVVPGQSKYRHDEQGKRVRTAADKIPSYGTERVYLSCLVQLAQHTTTLMRREGQLHRLKEEHLRSWLEKRAKEVGQKQLNNDRRAIEVAYQIKLTPLKSEVKTHLSSRAYSDAQVALVMARQTPRHRLATEIAHRCGLRAHELFTLRPAVEQPRSDRRGWRDDLFGARADDAVAFTVKGKGGLVRLVMVPRDLAERLEATRLAKPRVCRDQSIDGKDWITYRQYYDIGAGGNWSKSFGAAAERALGWSTGAHGLRHTFAQQRMDEEQRSGKTWEEALEVVSQELGHFREDITLVYLR